mgnify:CR=1 FL=1
MATRHAFSAPMARIVFDGNKEIGWASGINIQETIDNTPVRVLGSVYVQELVPTAVHVGVTCGVVHIVDETLFAKGVFVQGDTVDFVGFPELTLELYHQFADKPIGRVYGCKSASRGVSLGVGGIEAVNVRYDAIRYEELA